MCFYSQYLIKQGRILIWDELSVTRLLSLSISLSQPVDFETKRSYTLKVEGSNPHIDPQFLAWGPYKDEATIKVNM